MKNTTWIGLLVVGLGCALAGCDDSGDGAGGSGATASTGSTGSATSSGSNMATSGTGMGGCTVTLTGAVAKTLSCTATAAYSASNDDASVAINFAGGEGAAALNVDGMMTAQNYTWANSHQQGGSVLENNGSQIWGWDSMNMTGSSSVTISSVTVGSTAPNGDEVLTAHGSFTAVAKPLAGGTGDVNIAVTF